MPEEIISLEDDTILNTNLNMFTGIIQSTAKLNKIISKKNNYTMY